MLDAAWTKIPADKMTPIFQKPGRREIFQRDCEPKHTVKITQELLKKKKGGGTWPGYGQQAWCDSCQGGFSLSSNILGGKRKD